MARPFHVGVNLAYLRPGGVGGSETYVRRLLDALARIDGVRLTLYCNAEGAPTFAGVGTVVRVTGAAYSMGRRLWAENWSLRRPLRADPVDVLFSPGNFAAPLLPARVPQVATVHDLQHLALPENFSAAKRRQRTAMFKLSFAKCRRIIAISEFTRADVMRRFGVPGPKIVTVLEGVDRAAARDEARLQAARAKFSLPEAFFYYPATDAPHKNHATVIDALARLEDRQVELVFSGARGRGDDFAVRAAVCGVGDRVRDLGQIEHAEVFDVLRLARALVFPSEFEGFGLPPLEAMQCDTPVLASDCASIPEIVGEGGVLLPARETAAWTAAMQRVLTDGAWRDDLVARGRANLERFSWERCARETLEVLREAVAVR